MTQEYTVKKVTTWRECYVVEADSREEAIKKAQDAEPDWGTEIASGISSVVRGNQLPKHIRKIHKLITENHDSESM